MKKLLAAVFALAMLTGCSSSNTDPDPTTEAVTVEATPSATPKTYMSVFRLAVAPDMFGVWATETDDGRCKAARNFDTEIQNADNAEILYSGTITEGDWGSINDDGDCELSAGTVRYEEGTVTEFHMIATNDDFGKRWGTTVELDTADIVTVPLTAENEL